MRRPRKSPRRPATKKSSDPKDILVPIPSYSKDVERQRLPRARRAAGRIRRPGRWPCGTCPSRELISETIGRYSVRAILDAPEKFMASLAPLDADTRTLVMLDVLRDGLGRDGLHTYFFLSSGQHAPAIRDALQAAGLEREHALFVQGHGAVRTDLPGRQRGARERTSATPRSTQPLNEFDSRMMEISRSFGSRLRSARPSSAIVERTPALWQRIEASAPGSARLARLRHLNQALTRSINIWDKPDAEVAAQLAALPKEQRTLFAMEIFNAEFENGGVHQFFFNSSGAVAPEVYDAFVELGLDRQAAIFKRALDMFEQRTTRATWEGAAPSTSTTEDWNDWDNQLSALTDHFYELDGGPTVVRLGGNAAIEGGPGIWSAMATYARAKKLLPC